MTDKAVPIEPVDRIQENVLARAERRLLNRICAALPTWVTPDMLTALGMVGALMIFAGYLASNLGEDWLWMAIAGYAVQWFGDSTDGSLARFRKIERPRYGYFLDHSCDGMATTLIAVGMGLSPYVTLEIVFVALAGYLLMSIHAFLAVRVLGELRLSYFAFGPTELRVVLIVMTVAMMIFGTNAEPGWFGSVSGFDIVAGFAGFLLILTFVLQTLSTARRLGKEEPARNAEWRALRR